MELAKVEDQFKKSPGLKQEDIDKVHDWINKQPQLPKITGESIIKRATY